MANHDLDPERQWDEYEWERFLQQQDQKTQRYMELLEQYMDNPDRDAIIAQEMGWSQILVEDDFDDDEMDEDELDDEDPDEEEEEDPIAILFEPEDNPEDDEVSFEQNPLYQQAFSLTLYIDSLFDAYGQLPNNPAAAQLSTQCALASAKLAAALSGDESDEKGMTIAYLKRALRAISQVIECALVLLRDQVLQQDEFQRIHNEAFRVRDNIIVLMGDLRAQWRKQMQEGDHD
ncbi:MAG: hypothetical protein ACFCU3_06345 [Verrucomicrobiales bacterium]